MPMASATTESAKTNSVFSTRTKSDDTRNVTVDGAASQRPIFTKAVPPIDSLTKVQ